MSITTIRPHKAKRIAPEPKCGRESRTHIVMVDGREGWTILHCDLPADHLPATEHAALVRWSS